MNISEAFECARAALLQCPDRASVRATMDVLRARVDERISESEGVTKPAQQDAPTDAELRLVWKAEGGNFHGPNVETATMPLAKLFPFLRRLMGAPAQDAERARDAARWRFIRDQADPDDGPYIMDTAGNDLGMGPGLDAAIDAARAQSAEGDRDA